LQDRGIRSQEFVGREAAYKDLDKLWPPPDDRTCMILITGIAGVGKTELAIQYGRSRKAGYLGGVAWFSAAEFGAAVQHWLEVTFRTDRDFEYLDQRLALGWAAWRDYCTDGKQALVIIDDVTDYRQQVLPFLPKVESDRSPFRFLLTGRSRWDGKIPTLALAQLDNDAAVTMLAGVADSQHDGPQRIEANRTTAASLCDRLGNLPLAIALVGAWLSIEADRTLAQLIASLEQHGLDAPALERQPMTLNVTAERGLKAAFAVSWEQLAAMDPTAQQLARVLSLFAAADLPWSLVEAVVERYGQGLANPRSPASQRSQTPTPRPQPNLWQRLWQWLRRRLGLSPQTATPPRYTPTPIPDLITPRGTLTTLNLLERVKPATYRLHPLLREFFAMQWAEADRDGWAIAFAGVVGDRAREVPADVLWEQAAAFEDVRPHFAPARAVLQQQEAAARDPQTAARYRQQASDLNVAMFRLSAPPLFEATFAKACQQHDQAKALAAAGNAQLASQQFGEALAGYRSAIEQARKAFAKDSPQLAGYLYRLANLLYELGNYREGIAAAEEAVRIAVRQASPRKLATYLNQLAYLYYLQGRYAEAEPLYERSLAIYEQQLGADHSHVATSLNHLAELYRAQGRYAEAEPLYERSLAIREQQLGADHPDVATSLNNLAELYKSQGCYAEAEPLYVRSLTIREQQLGADHPDVAASLNNLAGLYKSQGRYGEAEPLYMRSLSIWEQQLGPDHPDVATSLNNLAGLYDSQSRYAEAEPLYVRSLAIREQKLGADHPHVATSLNNLAELYRAQGRYAEAEPLYVRALEILLATLGENHPHTQTARENFVYLIQHAQAAGQAGTLSAHPWTQAILQSLATAPDASATPESP
jgi:tetratricopeptide (TPR) repeat protein